MVRRAEGGGDGSTALIGAVGQGHLGVVGFLVANAADVNIRNNDDKTALFWATDRGHSAVADYLRSVGAEE